MADLLRQLAQLVLPQGQDMQSLTLPDLKHTKKNLIDYYNIDLAMVAENVSGNFMVRYNYSIRT